MNSSLRRFLTLTLATLTALSVGGRIVVAQEPLPADPHYLYHEGLPPGAMGQLALLKKRPVVGYFQPVEIVPPAGTQVSFINNGAFGPDVPSPALAGCLIGQVYRMRLSNIPLNPGVELYPTIELVDRLCPPPGKELKFPVPIHITAEEIRYASEGKMVVRVIYVEPPMDAIPEAQDKSFQPFFEVPPGGDPIQIADELGRPIAILRMGSRTITDHERMGEFDYRSPPIMVYDRAALGPDMAPVQGEPPMYIEPPVNREATRQPIMPFVPPTAYLPPNVAERPNYAPPGNVQTR
ncbi:hypothetical protein [Blastopirellula retiformator]|uniref:Uncharacterized protein n=1 Tax=Blastopirellula retiformator TaxID=2527970 RepID=A0A5C5VNQ4_9BACT|nr:hypothetical protein [Blastopirellula retiformator]TWT39573.1 hypothetical protein Enr8_12730 [Blastopirellula retiformator]